MHEIERHRLIVGEVTGRPVVTVAQLVEMTGASEATIRRDINALHDQGTGAPRAWRGRKHRRPGMAAGPDDAGIRGDPPAEPRRPSGRSRGPPRRWSATASRSSSMAARRPICLGPHVANRGLQVLTNSIDLALYLLVARELPRRASGRRHPSRTAHGGQPVYERHGDRAFLRGKILRRRPCHPPAGPDRGRSDADQGRAEDAETGRTGDRPRRRQQVPAARQPDPLRLVEDRPGRSPMYRRRPRRSTCCATPASSSPSCRSKPEDRAAN